MANHGTHHGGNGNRNDDDRGDDRDMRRRIDQRTSQGSGDWGQYDDGRMTYGRRGDGQGFRESIGYDSEREREPFGAQGGWNPEDRFGRRDDYQSNQDYGMRGTEYGRGQSGYGAGYQRERTGYGDDRGPWGRNDPSGPSGRFGAAGGMGRQERGNDGVGARDSERADLQQRSFRGVGPRGYRRSDQRIQDDVNDLFTDDERLDAANISVRVQHGEVTLTGSVSDRAMKYRAEELAERISGVKDIDNQLRVHKAEARDRGASDDEPGSSTSAVGTRSDDQARTSKPS